MMKMATGEGFPPPVGCRNGSRLVFGGYRGLRWRNSRSRLFSGGFCIYRNFWRREQVRGGPRVVHEIGRRARGVGPAPHPRRRPGTLLAQLFYSGGFFGSIKNRQKLARPLDSVWYSFSVKLKNKEKQKLGLGSRLIG